MFITFLWWLFLLLMYYPVLLIATFASDAPGSNAIWFVFGIYGAMFFLPLIPIASRAVWRWRANESHDDSSSDSDSNSDSF